MDLISNLLNKISTNMAISNRTTDTSILRRKLMLKKQIKKKLKKKLKNHVTKRLMLIMKNLKIYMQKLETKQKRKMLFSAPLLVEKAAIKIHNKTKT